MPHNDATTPSVDIPGLVFQVSSSSYSSNNNFPLIASKTKALHIHQFLTALTVKRQFKTDDLVYYKNSRTDDLDEQLGDVAGYIADVESSIIRELSNAVVEVAPVM